MVRALDPRHPLLLVDSWPVSRQTDAPDDTQPHQPHSEETSPASPARKRAHQLPRAGHATGTTLGTLPMPAHRDAHHAPVLQVSGAVLVRGRRGSRWELRREDEWAGWGLSRRLHQTPPLAGLAAHQTIETTCIAVKVLRDMTRANEDLAPSAAAMGAKIQVIQLAASVATTPIHQRPPLRQFGCPGSILGCGWA